LTPIECERLQTVPDNYTEGVSNTQRYKMLGNGWTVDVISHIFENLKSV
jgi:site-specific DNA-cytosine methylase